MRQSADPANLKRAAEHYAGPLLDGLNVADNGFEDWLREAGLTFLHRP